LAASFRAGFSRCRFVIGPTAACVLTARFALRRRFAFRIRGVDKLTAGTGSTQLTRDEFERRYKGQFDDPAFDTAKAEIERLTSIAWEAYQDSRKSPRTRKAGPEFAKPEHELAVEWLDARAAIHAAQREFENAAAPSRVLIICGSPRTDETCPSEMSKTFRLAQHAREQIEAGGFTADFLDLSRLTSEYGRVAV
jgi:hypothetical protein